MHLSNGEIQAYLDQELKVTNQQSIQSHLESCAACQNRLTNAASREELIKDHFELLTTHPPEHPESLASGLRKFQERTFSIEKEKQSMLKNTFARLPRPVWAGIGVILILGLALCFAPVRALANNFLGLFRVQQIRVLEVDPSAIQGALRDTSQFEYMISQDIQFSDSVEPEKVADLEQASALTGIMPRLPVNLGEPRSLFVQPGGNATFTIDSEHIRLILDQIGRSDIQLPAGLDGSKVKLEVPDAVLAQYGECQPVSNPVDQDTFDPDQAVTGLASQCTTFLQMSSPTISAPPGLDLQKLGEAYLQLLGMNEQEAQSLSQSVDWASTLVIPLPRNMTTFRQVQVDGVNGTLITEVETRPWSSYVLLWVKNDILYVLSGPGDGAAALEAVGLIE